MPKTRFAETRPAKYLRGAKKIRLFFFYHPDYTVGTGISPVRGLASFADCYCRWRISLRPKEFPIDCIISRFLRNRKHFYDVFHPVCHSTLFLNSFQAKRGAFCATHKRKIVRRAPPNDNRAKRISYPNATSRIIIRQNPARIPALATALFPAKHSGISSEQTTAIIAPAEKARAQGRSPAINDAATAPRIQAGFYEVDKVRLLVVD